MALSVHSWHSIRLSAHGPWPRGAGPTPGARRSAPWAGSGPGAPSGPRGWAGPSWPWAMSHEPWAESRIECQEWTDKAIKYESNINWPKIKVIRPLISFVKFSKFRSNLKSIAIDQESLISHFGIIKSPKYPQKPLKNKNKCKNRINFPL